MRVLDGTRHIECDGAFNIRDLGGYVSDDGRAERWCTLYRADGLHRIPLVGLDRTRALAWRTVLDLRTMGERELATYCDGGVEVVHLPLLRQTWERFTLTNDTEPVSFLVERYLEMLVEGAASIAASIDILSSRSRLPAVFHCSAGKDRTGVLASIVLAVLGVRDEDIAMDYHLSASAMANLVDWVVATHPQLADHMAQQPPAMPACRPEAMLELLDRIRARYGSVDGYLGRVGVSDDTIERLRSNLLI
jgi:protein-tyrosine phosphatase